MNVQEFIKANGITKCAPAKAKGLTGRDRMADLHNASVSSARRQWSRDHDTSLKSGFVTVK